ncbi:hypothetical protein [Rodentibacter haemolyticus]|uniref:DUF2393 domain-containing protein n=1 Tax=Rodentibacter haemolyticus TaxID=2778911 RepID=A0ABX6UX85_9PAST|nr:hypothetical protein [Rodentibacter haemolyticus]QPB42654.1 hypothetical protein IHV77_00560 [Rodentibacter haemolyticus]
MKNLKSLITLSMASLFFAMNVSAAQSKEGVKSESKKERISKITSVTQAISINAENQHLSVDNNGQALAVFKYTVSNISNKPISAVQWLSIYVNKREVVHSQDMNIDLVSPLLPGKSFTINLQLPFVQIQEKFRPVFMDSQAKIEVYSVDQVIRFSDQNELRER